MKIFLSSSFLLSALAVHNALACAGSGEPASLHKRNAVPGATAAEGGGVAIKTIAKKISQLGQHIKPLTTPKVAAMAGATGVAGAAGGYSVHKHVAKKQNAANGGGMGGGEMMRRAIVEDESTPLLKRNEAATSAAKAVEMASKSGGEAVQGVVKAAKAPIEWTKNRAITAVVGSGIAGYVGGYGTHSLVNSKHQKAQVVSMRKRSPTPNAPASPTLARVGSDLVRSASHGKGGAASALKISKAKVGGLAAAVGGSSIIGGVAGHHAGVKKSNKEAAKMAGGVDASAGAAPMRRRSFKMPTGSAATKGLMVAGATGIGAAGWATGQHVGKLEGTASGLKASRGSTMGMGYRKRSVSDADEVQLEPRGFTVPQMGASTKAMVAAGAVGIGAAAYAGGHHVGQLQGTASALKKAQGAQTGMGYRKRSIDEDSLQLERRAASSVTVKGLAGAGLATVVGGTGYASYKAGKGIGHVSQNRKNRANPPTMGGAAAGGAGAESGAAVMKRAFKMPAGSLATHLGVGAAGAVGGGLIGYGLGRSGPGGPPPPPMKKRAFKMPANEVVSHLGVGAGSALVGGGAGYGIAKHRSSKANNGMAGPEGGAMMKRGALHFGLGAAGGGLLGYGMAKSGTSSAGAAPPPPM